MSWTPCVVEAREQKHANGLWSQCELADNYYLPAVR